MRDKLRKANDIWRLAVRKIATWGSKKPDEGQTAKPEGKTLEANQTPAPAAASSLGAAQINNEGVRPAGVLIGRVGARLGAALHVKGEITGNEDLVIEGTFEGRVQLGEGKLTIGVAARVTADIFADEVVVDGNVKGNVRAKNRIEIKKGGSVTGDLTTPQIVIEDGAHFKGSIEINRGTEKEPDKSAFPPAA